MCNILKNSQNFHIKSLTSAAISIYENIMTYTPITEFNAPDFLPHMERLRDEFAQRHGGFGPHHINSVLTWAVDLHNRGALNLTEDVPIVVIAAVEHALQKQEEDHSRDLAEQTSALELCF
jgi:hypothetical protein